MRGFRGFTLGILTGFKKKYRYPRLQLSTMRIQVSWLYPSGPSLGMLKGHTSKGRSPKVKKGMPHLLGC